MPAALIALVVAAIAAVPANGISAFSVMIATDSFALFFKGLVYFAAFFGATAPRHIKGFVEGRNLTVRITNLGAEAWRIGAEGARGRLYRSGEVLYDGPALVTIAGTTPTYGYGMRLLPWADRNAGFFQLRISNVPLTWSLLQIRHVWDGTFAAEGLFDFYASEVRLEYSQPVPFQVAGDVAGMRASVEFRVVPEAVRLLRFL